MKKLSCRNTILLSTGLLVLVTSARAADYDYPELMVTPSASERLTMQGKSEESKRWTTHLPIQASALMTLTAGILQKDKNGARTGLAGIAVGGSWLIGTFILS